MTSFIQDSNNCIGNDGISIRGGEFGCSGYQVSGRLGGNLDIASGP